MRTLKTLTLIAIVCAPSMLGRPSIIINGDPPDPTIIFSNAFSFTANNLGGGDFSFVNGSNNRWTELDIFATLPELEAITCGPGPFITCTPTPLAPGATKPLPFDIIFGPAPNGGIAPGEGFSINLNDNGTTNTDPNGPGSWGNDASFNITANTPEPAAWALTAIGMLSAAFFAFLLRRRRA
ncbi:MAG TPA: PEP-CTERM sorting domain-containing protein [Bryobacteraceae bacterium]|jgi:hypothetical protein|nr:PEP-CTERM sorting domain-containing protein [Bryobacteraceae bacterium]